MKRAGNFRVPNLPTLLLTVLNISEMKATIPASKELESNDCVETFIASLDKSGKHFILAFSSTHNGDLSERYRIL